MNTKTARSLLSATTGLGLSALTTVSFLTAGIAAPATVLGISFLAVYGLFEIAVLETRPIDLRSARAALNHRRSAAVFEFPSDRCHSRAA
jgi:hypothetical protein